MLKDMNPKEVVDLYVKPVPDERSLDSVYEIVDNMEYQNNNSIKNNYPKLISTNFNVEHINHYGGEDCGSIYYDVFKIQDKTNEEDLFI